MKMILALLTMAMSVFAVQKMVVHTSVGNSTFTIAEVDSITFVNDSTNGISLRKDSIELFNGWGKGGSALDAKQGVGISGSIDPETGYITYTNSDSARIDIKTVNSLGRASLLTDSLISTNGTLFSPIDEPTYNKMSSTNLKILGDLATQKSIIIGTNPYFVAKLGGARGYIMVKALCETNYSGASAVNIGRVTLNYYYME